MRNGNPGSSWPPTEALRLEAPAKLNLSLSVVGRRPDGHHLLDSVFVLLELADRLLLMPGSSGLRIDGDEAAGMPLGAENLAWRGLRAGMRGDPDLACLTLEKRVPSSAGLGGGSSDAAAAWRLGRAWRGIEDAASPDDLVELASIGADVPFFAAGVAAARVTGIGERVESMAAEARHVVLVSPPFGLSTAAIFAVLRPDEWGRQENDLLAPALRLRPELADLLAAVKRAGGEPRLTGSGPTLFSLTSDTDRAASVADRLTEAGLRVTVTRTRHAAASIERITEEEN
ncbi:MAG: 4-(cytidine 5'-diphospho)-2-C-methyl-D-erythritol kinase [Chloroflexota bacterium]|nr:4-(cytidine 5'-diphospho)-2-C-methyl-D-erythritol kinase [Chloroflexota bacterium]